MLIRFVLSALFVKYLFSLWDDDSAVFISPSINEYLGHFVFKKALYRAEHIQTFVQRWLMLLDILLNKPHEALDNNMNLLRSKHTSVEKKSSKFLKLKK